MPRQCVTHDYRESVSLGYTSMTKQEVRRLLTDVMQEEWRGVEYDLLKRNCCHFSDTFSKALGLDGIPGWIFSLARIGASVESVVTPAVDTVEDTLVKGKVARGAWGYDDYRFGDFTRGVVATGRDSANPERRGVKRWCLC